jgi:carboxypeptidase T
MLCFLFLSVISVQAQKYSKLKVHLGNKTMSDIIQMGVDVDHGVFEKGNIYISDFSSKDIAILDMNHIPYDILIDDVVQYFLDQNKNPSSKSALTNTSGCVPDVSKLNVPAHWHLGSMGGYFTYAEMLQILDSMALLYPNLITIKKPVSDTLLTREGRPVYVVKISDNPNIDEANESKVLYTALHHAREPLSMSQLLMYMYYVLENYATDPQIKNIVDNTQMYFIPCVNPDGYLYNQSTNPNGGGMWRKNRVHNADLTYGVDLNRNYGKLWGYDNIGSSNIPSNETYRGPAAFSEPETRMIKQFCETNTIKFTLNYHTYGNDVIYPWGYQNTLSPDSDQFRAFAFYITNESKYKSGTCMEMLNYTSNGVSDDWFYGEQIAKNKIFAMTPECGNEFWMPASEITTTCQNLIEQNIKTASLILDVATIKDINPLVLSASTGFLKFTIQRIGLKNTDTFSVKLIPLCPALTASASPRLFTGMSLLQSTTDSISYIINPSLVVNRKIKYVLQVSKGSFIGNDTIEKIFADSIITVFQDNATNLSGWTNSGTQNWSLSTTDYVSAPSSIHDSPIGNYQASSEYRITSNNNIDLTNTGFAYLEFYTKWDIEKAYDYAQVSASETGVNNWTPLCGLYTYDLSAAHPGSPVYDGTQNKWVREHIDLSDWLGKKILLRFELITDSYLNKDGFYIDDLAVVKNNTKINTGISDNKDISITIMPNPATTHINIRLNNIQSYVSGLYEIKDITGRIVYSVLSNDKNKTIDITDLAPGIYIFCLTIDGNRLTKKFVVN